MYLRSFRSASSIISSIPNGQCFLNPIYTPEICVPDPGSTICYLSFKTDFCLSHRMKSSFRKVNGNSGVYFSKGQDIPLCFYSMVLKRILEQLRLSLSSSPHITRSSTLTGLCWNPILTSNYFLPWRFFFFWHSFC